jgi:putative ABC transport system ATP-binding protein
MGLSLSASHLDVRLKTGLVGPQAFRQLFDIDALTLVGGSSLALYGPSGSGKTTLLNLLAGLSHLPGSRIEWRKDSAGHTVWQQDIAQLYGSAADHWRLQHTGLVFQQFQLFASLSALENVLTPYRFDHWRCPPAARVRALQLLQQFGISATAATGRLSRGEQQRVALARALVREPEVILADEPTASLDPATAALVMDTLVGQCQARGLTLVVATHDTALATRFDRALSLHQGSLVPLEAA